MAISPVVNIGLQSLENYEDKAMVEKYKNWMETHISKYIMWDAWDGGFWQDNVFEKIFEMEKDILRALPKPEELRKGYVSHILLLQGRAAVELTTLCLQEEPWQVDMDTLEKVIPRLHLDLAILNHPDKSRNKFAQAKKPNIETVLLMQPKYWAKLNKILKDQPRDVMFLFQVWQGWRQLYNLWDGYYLTEWQEFLKEFDGKVRNIDSSSARVKASANYPPRKERPGSRCAWSECESIFPCYLTPSTLITGSPSTRETREVT